MHVFPPRQCPTCDKTFVPKSDKNLYCCRKCFKRAYYHRKKAEELSANHCPFFRCPDCGQGITLPFDPVKDSWKWLKYKCPGCNVLIIEVSDSLIVEEKN